ncbi:hypothetical protein OOJ91_33965 [Micromonospora lupini]|uniref:hypothetical protein n=1 Tax=Micromonospora lupini TaxID=285679 RepID=UPI002257C5CF|nr:hypothetical protein [Micromonospora lupini]MCX5070855.1 hypothetical protein [Micromonospora lupini]
MSQRQEERARRRRVFWSEKRAKARGDLAATVQVNYDLLRAEVAELPKGVQQQWLRTINDSLRSITDQVRASNPQNTPPASAGPRKP